MERVRGPRGRRRGGGGGPRTDVEQVVLLLRLAPAAPMAEQVVLVDEHVGVLQPLDGVHGGQGQARLLRVGPPQPVEQEGEPPGRAGARVWALQAHRRLQDGARQGLQQRRPLQEGPQGFRGALLHEVLQEAVQRGGDPVGGGGERVLGGLRVELLQRLQQNAVVARREEDPPPRQEGAQVLHEARHRLHGPHVDGARGRLGPRPQVGVDLRRREGDAPGAPEGARQVVHVHVEEARQAVEGVRVRPPEPVDGLPRVAHDAQEGARPRRHHDPPQEEMLRPVEVLPLVDEHEVVRLRQGVAVRQAVVDLVLGVQAVPVPEPLLHEGLGQPQGPHGARGGAPVLPPPVHLPLHGRPLALLLPPRHQPLPQPLGLLRVDPARGPRRPAERPPQAVEGAHVDGGRQDAGEALPQLARHVPVEGQQEDPEAGLPLRRAHHGPHDRAGLPRPRHGLHAEVPPPPLPGLQGGRHPLHETMLFGTHHPHDPLHGPPQSP